MGAAMYYKQDRRKPTWVKITTIVILRRQFFVCQIYSTSGFWPRVRARALRTPVFFGLINMPNGALRAPPTVRAWMRYSREVDEI